MTERRRQWWQRPRLRTDEEEERERRVSWLELFYDLVFVVVIAELTHALAEHVSTSGVLSFLLLFVPVWWIWIGGTFYNERFETADISYRLLTFGQMLPVAAMAVFAHDALGATSTEFALAYAAGRVVITLMWLRAGRHDAGFRPVADRYVAGFSVSVALFVLSVFVPAPWRFVLWSIGLLFDLVTPITTLAIQRRLPRLSTSKLPERFGLFVIIVLGEMVVGVVQGMAELEPFSATVGVAGALGMALAFGLWWVYFDFVARRPFKRSVWWGLGWSYLHLPLVIGIAATGAGVLNVLSHLDEPITAGARWLVAGAVATALLAIALIETTLVREPDEPTDVRASLTLKVTAALLALALGLSDRLTDPVALLVVLLALVAVQGVYGAYVWFRPAEGIRG